MDPDRNIKMLFVKRVAPLTLYFPALLLAVLVLYSTRWGTGVGYDSMFYLDAAENIAQGKGVFWIGSGGELKPLAHYPPLYSFLMAIPIAVGAAPETSARILALVIAIANSLLISYILHRYTKSLWFSLIGTLLLIFSPVIFRLHLLVMSEPLFFFWMLLSFALLTEYLTADKKTALYGAAVSIALACLTRYVGLAVLAACVLGMLLLKRGPVKGRVRSTGLLISLGIIPVALWMIRNWLLTGTTTNRTFQVHLIDVDTIRQLLDVIVDWFTRVYISHWLEGIILSLFFIGMLSYLIWRLYIKKERSRASLIILLLLTVFPLIYLVQVMTSLSFLDASTRLDDRILSPVFLSVGLIWLLFAASARSRTIKTIMMIGLVTIVAVALVPAMAKETIELSRSMHAEGSGFSSREWHESEIINWIRSRNVRATIVTNQAMAVRFLTDFPAIQVPESWDPVKGQERIEYPEELSAVLDAVSEPDTFVVLFTPRDISVPQDRTWLDGLKSIYQTEEGEVFVYAEN